MRPAAPEPADATFVNLEFDTGTKGGAQLGDIAASLVSLDELLRDLASIAAYPSSAEYRKVEIVAIELRSPLKIRLSLFAIEPAAVKAFQKICREIILFRDGGRRHAARSAGTLEDANAPRLARIKTTLEGCVPEGSPAHISEKEMQRILGHMLALQSAEIRLKRVEVI